MSTSSEQPPAAISQSVSSEREREQLPALEPSRQSGRKYVQGGLSIEHRQTVYVLLNLTLPNANQLISTVPGVQEEAERTKHLWYNAVEDPTNTMTDNKQSGRQGEEAAASSGMCRLQCVPDDCSKMVLRRSAVPSCQEAICRAGAMSQSRTDEYRMPILRCTPLDGGEEIEQLQIFASIQHLLLRRKSLFTSPPTTT